MNIHQFLLITVSERLLEMLDAGGHCDFCMCVLVGWLEGLHLQVKNSITLSDITNTALSVLFQVVFNAVQDG